jgi:hypothetical protein
LVGGDGAQPALWKSSRPYIHCPANPSQIEDSELDLELTVRATMGGKLEQYQISE